MRNKNWRGSSKDFFDLRASQVKNLELSELCYVSGREPRLWSDKILYDDMIESILDQSGAAKFSSLLEVGCASGFLAWGIAPQVNTYMGLDVAPRAIKIAKKLNLPGAKFQVADGTKLPVSDNCFDSAICYDVFTNFPDFIIGETIIREMLRVVKPGGRVLIGSIPDANLREQYELRVLEVMKELEKRYGPPPIMPDMPVLGILDRIWRWLRPIQPQISCYYFHRTDFLRLGDMLGLSVEIVDIHSMNPYLGFRFNAIFTK